jgi:hypothetical protein
MSLQTLARQRRLRDNGRPHVDHPGIIAMESLPTSASPPPLRAARAPRHLAAGDGASFWGEAWRIFCAAPLTWMLIVVAYLVISIVLTIIPVVGGLAHIVLTPVFVGGMMQGCQALARGERLEFAHLFAGFGQGRLAPLAVLGMFGLAAAIVFGILLVAGAFVTIGMSGLGALIDYGNPRAITSAAGIGLLGLLLLALVCLTLVAMAFWFAPALVALDGIEPVAALKASFEGSLANLGPFLVYGLVYIGLAILASIPLGLGWLVLGPMMAGSCYASWRRIFSA